jgi:hypothetical protein
MMETVMTLADSRLQDLASQLSSADGVKAAAKIRNRCTLEEWKVVLREARRIYHFRFVQASRS